MPPESSALDPPVSPATIRCLHCDYDLRGLPGDPVRCPECGQYTSYAEYAARLALRSKAGIYSSWAALIFPAVCLSAAASIAAPACAACGLLPTLAIWLALIDRVRREAGGAAGWVAVFVGHQLLVFVLIALVLACVPICVWSVLLVIHLVDSTQLAHGPRELVGAAGATVVVGLIATLFLRIVERVGEAARGKYDELNRCPPLHARRH